MGYGQRAGGTHYTGMHSCFETGNTCDDQEDISVNPAKNEFTKN